ncbi:hypothetical protein FUA26_04600 [Seonamhaeicola algicola]|uniref:Lipoprotein n=1 Tax=Seonamhaeicola algicola TaxID=1719036 RepID=A0A5C7AWK2_9FLAO|nr:hypothetical protein [Seonamhaeicola algicola]TXE13080.1 hypothetical protein FUA26_04600 [Seonamhaeicola algicola]
MFASNTFKFVALIFVLSIVFLAGCLSDDDNQVSSYNSELETLTQLKNDIETIAESSVCNETSTCKIIAFGSKPCGGPWSYLVYSTSINIQDFETKVEQYNQLESIFNAKWGVVSDCAVILQPKDVTCQNNVCVPVY